MQEVPSTKKPENATDKNSSEAVSSGKTLSRTISIGIFVFGLLVLAGANSYKDFYTDLKMRYTGQAINFEQVAEFCGWTGKQLPGESDWAYAFRSFWNMASAMLGMTALSFLAFGLVFLIIFLGFYFSGAFK